MDKLSLNIDKKKYIFFHKQRDKDNIPLRLPDLKLSKICLPRVNKLKSLSVFFGRKSELAKSHSVNLE